jgi:exopolysaccharide biosynthesis polyprenyl glycosylphosphotransferase
VSVLGRLADLEHVLREQNAIGVVVSLPAVGQDEVNALTRRLTDHGFHVALSSSLADIDVTRLRPQQVDGRTMIYVEPVIRHGWRRAAKRTFDVLSASLLLLVTAPVVLLTMLAIKLDSPGKVFFRQERVGRDGNVFTLLKLRTMVADADLRKDELLALNEADGPLFKIHNDPRITRVGRVLRKLSIDELPQLLCVIRGTMSMVGPRPALASEVEMWDPLLHERLRVLPGLTGLWQVSGRSDSSFDRYRRLDLYYVDNWSLLHDLTICVKTFGVVLSGRGAA